MIRIPSAITLKKYGLTAEEWLAILKAQGGVCAICKKVPTTGRMDIDHYHRKGWKKLPPEKRKRWVRGLCCFWCNKTYLGRGITITKAEAVVAYLKAFEARKPV